MTSTTLLKIAGVILIIAIILFIIGVSPNTPSIVKENRILFIILFLGIIGILVYAKNKKLIDLLK